MQPKYKFYATLLDSYQWYLDCEDDNSFQEFIDKINRVPFTSEAAEKGTNFNKLVDQIKNGELNVVNELGVSLWYHTNGSKEIEVPASNMIFFEGFLFSWPIVLAFVKKFKNAIDQVFTEAILPTPKGNVLLYGYLDEVLPGGAMYDIKTTGQYTFPKFLGNYQHLVYPYCMNANGIEANQFIYEVTDFKNIYPEEYTFHHERDTARLKDICTRLIDFLESNRELITDLKVFANDTVLQNASR